MKWCFLEVYNKIFFLFCLVVCFLFKFFRVGFESKLLCSNLSCFFIVLSFWNNFLFIFDFCNFLWFFLFVRECFLKVLSFNWSFLFFFVNFDVSFFFFCSFFEFLLCWIWKFFNNCLWVCCLFEIFLCRLISLFWSIVFFFWIWLNLLIFWGFGFFVVIWYVLLNV